VHYILLEMAAGSAVNGSLTHTVAAEAPRDKPVDVSVEVTEATAASTEDPLAIAKVD